MCIQSVATLITPDSRVLLAFKARLRHDHVSGHMLLLFPESGMELSETAACIIQYCDGRSVAEIVDALSREYGADRRDEIERDVLEFLRMLENRCLLTTA